MGTAKVKLHKNNNQTSKTFGKIYGRIKLYSRLTAKELAEHTAQDSRIEQASVEKVMDAIFKQIKEQLLNGHFIKLPGLGTLKIGVHPATDKDGKSVGGAKTEKEYSCQKHLGGAHLLFQPSQDIKSELHAVKFDASSDEQHLAELAALNADDGE